MSALDHLTDRDVDKQHQALVTARRILVKVSRVYLGTGPQLEPEELAGALGDIDVALGKLGVGTRPIAAG